MAIVVSLGLSTFGSQFATQILDWLGLGDQAWLGPVVTVITLLIAMAADVLIFMWVYTMLPGKELRSPFKARLRGSILAAVGFEILKYALIVLLPGAGSTSKTAAIFGPVIGLLFFFNLVAQMVLFVAAWIATAEGGPELDDGPLPEVPEATLMVRKDVSHDPGRRAGRGRRGRRLGRRATAALTLRSWRPGPGLRVRAVVVGGPGSVPVVVGSAVSVARARCRRRRLGGSVGCSAARRSASVRVSAPRPAWRRRRRPGACSGAAAAAAAATPTTTISRPMPARISAVGVPLERRRRRAAVAVRGGGAAPELAVPAAGRRRTAAEADRRRRCSGSAARRRRWPRPAS